MTDKRALYPLFRAFKSGDFAHGYKLYTYADGTSTEVATYTDVGLSIPHKNPIILDAKGEAEIFIAEPTKFVLKDQDDTTIWTVDDTDATTYAASTIVYDNTTSGYVATQTQAAIDEIDATVDRIAPPENLIKNSECMIDQRNEGVNKSLSTGTLSGYGVDRIRTIMADIDQLQLDVIQSTGIGGCRNSLLVTADTAETNWTDTSEYAIPFEYRFLGYDVGRLVNGATVTISFYFKSNHPASSVFSVALVAGDSGYSYVTDFTYTTSATVQYVTKTIVIPAHADQYISNSTTGCGLKLYIAPYAGTDFQVAAGDRDAWQAGHYMCSASATDWTQAVSGPADGYVQMSGLQFVVGSKTRAIIKKTRSQYLEECLPYYRKSWDQGAVFDADLDAGAIRYYVQEANTADSVWVDFNPPMVGAPTVALFVGGSEWYNNTDEGSSGTAAAESIGMEGFAAQNPSVATDGVGDDIWVHYIASAEI